VRILLGRDDIDPNKPDNQDRTALWWAAYKGHERVVEILLGRDDVDPDRADMHTETPFWWAARNGRERVVKMLRKRRRQPQQTESSRLHTTLVGC